MLRVLRHYLPIRKLLLTLSETALLTLVISAWMTAHLWDPTQKILDQLSGDHSMSPENAILRCIYSSFRLAVLSQIAIAFNELYDVRISGSRYDRSSRFVESAGSALGLTLLALLLAHTWGLKQVLDFPPLPLGQRVQTLVFAMLSGFALLYVWRSLFHYLLRRVDVGDRVLILGAGKAAHELALQILERPDTGFVLVGLLPDASAAAQRTSGASNVRHAWSQQLQAPLRGGQRAG